MERYIAFSLISEIMEWWINEEYWRLYFIAACCFLCYFDEIELLDENKR